MHPALETSVYAGMLPTTACGIVTASGVWLACKCSDRLGKLVAGILAAAGAALALAAANARLGLAPWFPDDALDWFLWAPPLVAFAAAWRPLCGDRRSVAIPLYLVIATAAAWLLTPEWASLGAQRWLWMAGMAGTASGVWLVTAGALRHSLWVPPVFLAAGCALQALLLAVTGNMRLADFATVGAATMAAAVLVSLLFRGEPARPPAAAAIGAHVAAASVLLAALAVYGALLNYSEYPNAIFFAPLLAPLAAVLPAVFRKL